MEQAIGGRLAMVDAEARAGEADRAAAQDWDNATWIARLRGQGAERELALMRKRRQDWVQGRPPPQVRGRLVLVVDDGIATGATMIAAIESLLPQKPARLICATPIASRDCLSRLREITHDLVYLAAPEDFRAVGQYYINFRPVEDVEVKAILAPFAIAAKPD